MLAHRRAHRAMGRQLLLLCLAAAAQPHLATCGGGHVPRFLSMFNPDFNASGQVCSPADLLRLLRLSIASLCDAVYPSVPLSGVSLCLSPGQHAFANLGMSSSLEALVDAHGRYGMQGFLSIQVCVPLSVCPSVCPSV